MGDIHSHPPVLLLAAAFSRHLAALAWGRERMGERYGPVALASPEFEFVETNYYEPTMGPRLIKQFWAFERPFDPVELPAVKLQTNDWEAEYAALARHQESRPLNLDPGYLTVAKLVLASTKDHAHRIYLGNGIFAEVTLYFKDGRWQPRDWTFPDYRRADYHEFLMTCRNELRRRSK